MKRIFFLVAVLAVVIGSANHIELTKETISEMEFEFHLADYQSRLVERERKYYEYFEVPEQAYEQKAGYPLLPLFYANIIIPHNDKMEIEIAEVVYEEIKVSTILPAGNENEQEPLSFSSVYEENEWYPASFATLSKPYIFGDVRGITITFHPFRYHPISGIVQVAKQIKLKLKSVGISEHNPLYFQRPYRSRAFHYLYQNFFINYDNSFSNLEHDGEMVVISPEKFSHVVQPLVRWKNQKGIKTTLLYYPDYTGTSWQDIQSFLQRQYETTGLTYILLVGDSSLIPLSEQGGVRSDWGYTCLAGDDYFPDVLIGRLPVASLLETESLVHKIVHYEKNPLSQQTQLTGLLLSPQYADEISTFRSNEYQVYSSLSERQIANYWNAGLSWFLYDGGFATNENFREMLRNEQAYPLLFSLADDKDSIETSAQQLLTTPGDATASGAVAYLAIANRERSKSRLHSAWQTLIEDDFHSIAALMLHPILAYPNQLSQASDTHIDSYYLYGDPSLALTTKMPVELFVQHAHVIDSTAEHITFTVRNQNGLVTDAVVAVSQDGNLIQSDYTDRFGEAKIQLPAYETRRLLDVTVTSRNHIPYLGSIHIKTAETENINLPILKADVFPNPFYAEGMHRSGQSNLFYEINEHSRVKIAIYNSLGQLIRSVFDGEQAPGQYSFQWNGTDEFGRKVSSGTYLYLIEINHQTISKKMLLIK